MFCKKIVALFSIALIFEAARGTPLNPVEHPDGETERIIDGEPAEDGMFPWMVALFYQNRFICSASLISTQAILTAAHCVYLNGEVQSPSEFSASVGSANMNSGTKVQFNTVIVHPDYDPNSLMNDIAVIQPTEPIQFNENTQPICLSSEEQDKFLSANSISMGWGNTKRNGRNIPETLQYAEQRIVNNTECRASYGSLPETQICAVGYLKNIFDLIFSTRSGICNGDSGGPLINIVDSNMPVQRGIHSYIRRLPGCGYTVPAVSTRVSMYTDFIRENADAGVCFV